jgi:hypothetical protein
MKTQGKTDPRNGSDKKYSDNSVHLCTRPKLSLHAQVKKKSAQLTKIDRLSVLTGIPARDIFCLLTLVA